MERFSFRACMAMSGLCCGIVVAPALAQYPSVSQGPQNYSRPPAISPYLNLLRTGADPAINYYGIVRPQNDFRNSIQGLQQQVGTLNNQTTASAQGTELPFTGHQVQFMNWSGYFGRPLNSGTSNQALNSKVSSGANYVGRGPQTGPTGTAGGSRSGIGTRQ
jgi:hypothetical protein